MFSVSFRIPFNLFGKTQYINGSALAASNVRGSIDVFSSRFGKVRAEVVQVTRTQRSADTYEWSIA